MSNSNFDPLKGLQSLRESVSRIIEEGVAAVSGSINVLVDVYETESAVVIKTEPLAGIDLDTVDVSVTGDTLTVKGECKPDPSIDEKAYLRRERRFGTFARSVKIPRRVQPDKAVAEFKEGVLTITLPKAEETEPKVINIRTFNV
jgi:HSP20 family protein